MATTITTVGENLALAFYTEALNSILDHVSKTVQTDIFSLYGTFGSNVRCVGNWLELDKNHLLSLHRARATLRLELRLNRRPQPGSGSGSWLSPEPEPGCLPELSTGGSQSQSQQPSLHLEFAIHASISLMTFPDTSWMFFPLKYFSSKKSRILELCGV